jgi:hypothetical protein
VEGHVKQKNQKRFIFFARGIHIGRPVRTRWVSCSVEIKDDWSGPAGPLAGALHRQLPQPLLRPCQLRQVA